MKNTAVLIIFLVISGIVNAQTDPIELLMSKRPYYIINGTHVSSLSFLLLNYEQIENMNVIPANQSGKYGQEAAQNGAVEITLKKNAPLISVPGLLQLFHIGTEALNLPKWIGYQSAEDYLPLEESESLVISPDIVNSVSIGYQERARSLSIHRKNDILHVIPTLSMNPTGTPFDKTISSLNEVFFEEVKKIQEARGPIIICSCPATPPEDDPEDL